MIRDPRRLMDKQFDLLVIGGGIYGAWTAYDAVLRGLDVALIDKGDWASGTSSASSKLIHGGLRYLELFKFGLVKKSLQERAKLIDLAPHRVEHLKFLIPIYSDSRVGSLRLRAGLWLYDTLAGKKAIVHPHEYLKLKETCSRYPFLSGHGLKGALTYGDCQTDDFRFTLEIINGAYDAGAVAVNYIEAVDLLTKNGQVLGANVTDRTDQTTFEVRASITVNASGPWLTRFGQSDKCTKPIRLTKGVHIVLPKIVSNDAILGMSKQDGRVFFIIPWYGKTLIGTTDTHFAGDPDHVEIEDGDVDYLITAANRILNDDLSWNRSSVIGNFCGLRALKNEMGKSPSSVTREWALEETQEGLLSSIGGKFTSSRQDAAVIVDQAMEILQKPRGMHAPTEARPFPWCPQENFMDWKRRTLDENIHLGLDVETAEWCSKRYGSSIRIIQELIRHNNLLKERIHPDLPFCKAEIIHAAKNEMAANLADIFRRRIPIMLLALPDRALLEDAIMLAGSIFGLAEGQFRQEVDTTLHLWDRV